MYKWIIGAAPNGEYILIHVFPIIGTVRIRYRSSVLLFVIVVAFLNCDAQSNIKPEKVTTWIRQQGAAEDDVGYLREASLESLVLSPELLPSDQTGFQSFPVSEVATVKFRKKTAQGWGALIGVVGGATAGALLGYAVQGNDFCNGKCGGTQPGTFAILGGIGGAMIGASVGVAIGSRKKKIHLNGRMTDAQLEKLLPYVNHQGS